MKKIFFFLLLSILLYSEECSNTQELHNTYNTIESFEQQYNDVPNHICVSSKDKLYKDLCKKQDLRAMFQLLSIANIYAYENATKREVNHHSFNSKHLNFDLSKYSTNGEIKFNQLCFSLKEKITDLLGGLSPYHFLILKDKNKDEIFFIMQNKHGYILKNSKGYTIYLGNKCDVLDSFGNHGLWGRKSDNIYHLNIGKKEMTFYDDSGMIKCDE